MPFTARYVRLSPAPAAQPCPPHPTTHKHTPSDICKIIFAVVLPPLGVFLERGCNADFLINILLTVLGYIPVSLHVQPGLPLHRHRH
jgi:uncharacterized membrane protein YqaE (UPF0057 family)